MSSTYEWINTYIQALPPMIRPATDDTRFTAAAVRAKSNGWTPTHAARIVCTVNYAGAWNPPIIALINLERIAERAPHQQQQRHMDASGCVACAPGANCQDPITDHDRIPDQWLKERWDLIRELTRTPDLSEDEREETMRVLIAHQ